MAESRMLVSDYVSENRDRDRQVARACNIAKWFVDNFKPGERVSSKVIRQNIPAFVKDLSLNDLGDLKAHGNAVQALDLGRLIRDGETFVDFSYPNLIRCARWVLGQGKKVDAIKLIKDEIDKDQDKDDCGLIDLALKIPVSNLSYWENDFVSSLDKNWRVRGLSVKQRFTLTKIISERS